MKDHYSLSSILKLIRDPAKLKKVGRILKQDIVNFFLDVNRRYYKYQYNGPKTRFCDEDWDTLIILDAARLDLLRELDPFPDADWDYKYSPGSYSYEFMEAEFAGRDLHDTVYITGNPYASKINKDVFYDVINLHDEGWDWDAGTVQPETVVEAASRARKKHPNKRYIVHFMQPHFPFIGSKYGDKIKARLSDKIGDGTGVNPWDRQMYWNEYDREVLLAAYRENHEAVVPFAKKLADAESGQTVITADHSNLIGERGRPIPIRQYGHPVDFPHPKLLKVPWITFEGKRRETISEEPVERASVSDDVINERLTALGYQSER